MIISILAMIIATSLLGFIIYAYFTKYFGNSRLEISLILGVVILLVAGAIISYLIRTKGDYSDLVDKYGMEYHEDMLGKDKYYTKGNTHFSYNLGGFKNNFIIKDDDDPDIDLHAGILKNICPISKDILSNINQYLHKCASDGQKDCQITIEGNHFSVLVYFNYYGKSIKYTIVQILPSSSYYDREKEQEITRYNDDYPKLYVKDRIIFQSYNESHKEYYKNIIIGLYGNYNESNWFKTDNNIEYKR